MKKFRLPGTTRASFYFYNTTAEIDRMSRNPGSRRAFLFMKSTDPLEDLYQQSSSGDHSRVARGILAKLPRAP